MPLSIVKSLMHRDGISLEEANDIVIEAKIDLAERMASGEDIDPMDICAEYFGLEPDFLDELLFAMI